MGGSTGSSAARTQIFSYQITPCTTNAAGVAIALTSGSNPACTGSSVTFTATPTNGGTAPAYQWKVNGANVGTNAATYSSSTLTTGNVVTCVMTSNLAGVTNNPATSNAITMTVNAAAAPSVTISQTTGTNPICAGATATFTATPTNGGTAPAYQWKVNGANVGTNAATYSSTTLATGSVISCVMTSNSSCASPTIATSGNITMTVNPSVVPAVSIALTAGTNPSAAGASKTFTATATNGGTTPSYQWKVSGVNAGTNSNTFTTTTLTNGQIVTCVMTSNATCAVPASATSNAITITITGGTGPCAAGTTNTTYEYISNVAMGSIANASTGSSYTNYTALSTNVSVGLATPITVSIGNPYASDKVLIWVDWNNDMDFVDVGEAVYSSATGVGPFTTSITPPAGTLNGSKTMRIRLTDNSSGPNLTPCGNSTYGEVEDYKLNVVTGAVTYCVPSTTNTTYEFISKVIMGTVSNTTTGSSYSNFSALSTNAVAGSTVAFTVTIGNAYSSDKVLIWCDWNQDGDFNDASEALYSSPLGVGPFSTNVVVPTFAFNGNCRVRIRLTDNSSGPNLTPCGASSYGEVEDYTIAVSGGTNKGSTMANTVASEIEKPLLNAIELTVYPNPNTGSFAINGEFAGDYYLMNQSGILIQKITLSAENNYSVKLNNLKAGYYILSGQNKHGISKQKIIVTD